MVDIHSHILHGIFDSPPSISISLEIAKQYVKYGFTHVVSTPHYNPANEDVESFLIKCDDRYRKLDNLLTQENVKISIIPGAEVVLCPELLKINNIDKLCINNSEYMLVEFPFNQFPSWSQNVLFELGLKNITPILAHPERNKEIYKHFKKFSTLIDTGLLLQINAISLFTGSTCKKMIRRLFAENAVYFIASDTHLPDQRLACFHKSISILEKRYGANKIKRILNNSTQVINNCLIVN